MDAITPIYRICSESAVPDLGAPKSCQEADLWKTAQTAENKRKIFFRQLGYISANLLHWYQQSRRPAALVGLLHLQFATGSPAERSGDMQSGSSSFDHVVTRPFSLFTLHPFTSSPSIFCSLFTVHCPLSTLHCPPFTASVIQITLAKQLRATCRNHRRCPFFYFAYQGDITHQNIKARPIGRAFQWLARLN